MSRRFLIPGVLYLELDDEALQKLIHLRTIDELAIPQVGIFNSCRNDSRQDPLFTKPSRSAY